MLLENRNVGHPKGSGSCELVQRVPRIGQGYNTVDKILSCAGDTFVLSDIRSSGALYKGKRRNRLVVDVLMLAQRQWSLATRSCDVSVQAWTAGEMETQGQSYDRSLRRASPAWP